MIEVVRDNSAQDFLKHAANLLYRDEAAYSLMLGLCETIVAGKLPSPNPPLFIRLLQDAETVAAVLQTPPLNLIITVATQEHLASLAHFLKKENIMFPGIVGPADTVDSFAKIWSRLTGCRSEFGMGQRLYKLEKVTAPRAVPGQLRIAVLDDLNLVTQWLVEFSEESLPAAEQRTFEERIPYVERSIQNNFAYLWEVDGEATSVAHLSRPTKNGISVICVYTPKGLRKRGYASALVAQLSQKMLDSGKHFCALNADSANPTSNRIYQDMGYVDIGEGKHLLFISMATRSKPSA